MLVAGGATAYLGGATAYLVGGATAYLSGRKMNWRIRLTSAKVWVEVKAELGKIAQLLEGIKNTNPSHTTGERKSEIF